jgi:hypothetical protein
MVSTIEADLWSQAGLTLLVLKIQRSNSFIRIQPMPTWPLCVLSIYCERKATIMVINVDDGLVSSNIPGVLTEIIEFLKTHFQVYVIYLPTALSDLTSPGIPKSERSPLTNWTSSRVC